MRERDHSVNDGWRPLTGEGPEAARSSNRRKGEAAGDPRQATGRLGHSFCINVTSTQLTHGTEQRQEARSPPEQQPKSRTISVRVCDLIHHEDGVIYIIKWSKPANARPPFDQQQLLPHTIHPLLPAQDHGLAGEGDGGAELIIEMIARQLAQ